MAPSIGNGFVVVARALVAQLKTKMIPNLISLACQEFRAKLVVVVLPSRVLMTHDG